MTTKAVREWKERSERERIEEEVIRQQMLEHARATLSSIRVTDDTNTYRFLAWHSHNVSDDERGIRIRLDIGVNANNDQYGHVDYVGYPLTIGAANALINQLSDAVRYATFYEPRPKR